MAYFTNIMVLLSGKVQKEPMLPIRVIANLLGYILNFIFNFVTNFTEAHALGLSIVLFTIITRLLMLPLAINSQKSMAKTQKIQPEVDKINKKYGNTTDPDLLQKKNTEIQTLYAKEGVNPIAGCLPLLIQLPIFFALSYVMQQSFLYIDKLNVLYVDKLASTILSIPESLSKIAPIISSKLTFDLDIAKADQLAMVLSKCTDFDWGEILAAIPADFAVKVAEIEGYLIEKNLIDTFFGLKLTDTAGLSWPKIIIPILAAGTTFLSSYIITKQQKNTSTDPAVAATQKYTMFVMPIMMGFFTISTPIGVGIYWITSNIFQLFQQIVLNKAFSPKKENDF